MVNGQWYIYQNFRWLTEKKMDLGGPLSGLCHWFAVNPEKTLQKTLQRPGIENLHLNRHLITNEIPSRAGDGQVKTDLMVSSHLHESTSISIIMILATVLFILLITAFVTCITRKKRRPQVRRLISSSHYPAQCSVIVLSSNRNDILYQNNIYFQNVESQCQVVSDPRRTRNLQKDKPPDYDEAVRMKEREELELPSYSEAVSDKSDASPVDNDIKTSQLHPQSVLQLS